MPKRITALLLLLIITFTACGGSDDTDEGQLRLFDWDQSSESILFRIDYIDETLPDYHLMNMVPPCTIYGNGRVVFTTPGGAYQEVLETRVTPDQIRAYVERVIGTGFYSWEDDLVDGSRDSGLETITLNLYAEPRTVERYGDWPVDGYNVLLEDCRGLNPQRALVLPTNGGWLRAYPADPEDLNNQAIQREGWPRLAAFSLEELALSGSPIWVDDPPYIGFLWEVTRSRRPTLILEGNRGFYVSFQAPGISRSAPPAPLSE